jgi:hypothetical protein
MRIDKGPFISWTGELGMKRCHIIHDICKPTLSAEAIMKNDGEYRRCSEHGQVKLVPFYVMRETEITKEKTLYLYWGCYLCFQKAYGTIMEVETECCHMCNELNNLVDCTICADAVCKNHQIQNICMECINKGRDA